MNTQYRRDTKFAIITPALWAAHFAPDSPEPPTIPLRGGFIRHWKDTSPVMEQPQLDHHYIALHLGGAKRVQRYCGSTTVDSDVPLGAITLVCSGSEYRWQTQGPIEFAHLYIDPRRLDQTIRQTYDKEPKAISLVEHVGKADPLVYQLMSAMVEMSKPTIPDASIALETWYEALLARLIYSHSTLDVKKPHARHAIAPSKLRLIQDYIDANLMKPLTLAELAQLAGVSQFHFSRSFHNETGYPPYLYVTKRRIAYAKKLLRSEPRRIDDIARTCGFTSHNQFATTFRKHTGQTPMSYRKSH